ncbi:MAG: fused FliR family export protein/FlhB family type III secretion system protein [Bacillota bacterium]|nr:fused FliR family export protein/FlhB family type III secretion system protein [Bacillota bacterium]
MINAAYFLAFFLVFLRMISFFGVLQVFFPTGVPSQVKIAFAMILTLIMVPIINHSYIAVTMTNYELIIKCMNEVITGLTMGFVTNLCFVAVRLAGQFMDTQMGFSMLSMYDPTANSSTTFLEHILYWFCILVFFNVDGHHVLIEALIDSFDVIKIGNSILNQNSIMIIIKAFIQFFAIGLKIAVPIVLIMILTDLTMGLIARAVPQLNVMILGMPVKILLGLTSFCFLLPLLLKLILGSFDTLWEILKQLLRAAPILFIFASDDKTEEATPKKKSEARKKGQVAKSKEVGLAVTLMAATLVLVSLGGYAGNSLKSAMDWYMRNISNTNLTNAYVQNIIVNAIYKIASIILPMILPIMVLGVAANLLQTGFLISPEAIKPQLSKLNPLSGFKRIFSSRTFAELLKDLVIVFILGYIGYDFIKSNYTTIINMNYSNLEAIPAQFGKLVINIFFKITIIMVIIALIDYLFQRYQYNKELKMTKQEIKEEYKQEEGDPQIKSKIKQKQREFASKRMMQQVPKATVVVTNPTHIAVALKYAEGESAAPRLVAKGVEGVALKIKEIAKDNDVPIIENKPLARLIYNEVRIDSEIPSDMYQAVAEILAVVYKMKNKSGR